MNEQKQFLSIPIAIIIAGALVAGGIYFSGRGSQTAIVNNANTASVANIESIKPISATDHVLGNPKADIVIVEYSDIECPFCKQFHSTLHQLMSEYGAEGKLAWVYRHFPIDNLHSKARKEAEATECAAELGGNDGFWKYIDAIFAITPSNNGLDPAKLPVVAEQVGLDVTKFNVCLSSGKYAQHVANDLADATTGGARGTPYSVIFAKGDRIPLTQGALPYNDMKTIIDTILKN